MTNQPIEKFLTTGIDGLDDLFEGGIKLSADENLIMLIKGSPGAGKTTLALQIALNARHWSLPAESGYWSVEQKKEDIQKKAKILCPQWDGQNLTVLGNEDFPPSKSQNIAPFKMNRPVVEACLELRKLLNDQPESKYRILVLDGLNLLGSREREIVEIEQLITLLRKRARVGIIVFEPNAETYGSIDYQADLVLELRGQEILAPVRYFLTDLRIAKSRFQKSVLGWHQYKTREEGLMVYPSVHFRLSKHKSVDKCVAESIPSIVKVPNPGGDEERNHNKDTSFISFFLNGGKADELTLEHGSCTVLLGPRRCFKTQLTFDFLRAGSILESPEPGLLVSLIDNQSTIIGQRITLCERCCAKRKQGKQPDPNCHNTDCYKHVHLFHMPPGCITTAEFLHWLEVRLQSSEQTGQTPLQRLVFWDLAQLEFRFPLFSRDPMFLPGLIDYLKYSPRSNQKGGIVSPRKVTSLFMGPPNNELARAASAMADNVIFCWPDYFNIEQEGIAVYVDRIEGHPGEQKLFFAASDEPTEAGDKTPGMNYKLVRHEDQAKLRNATAMITEIQSLQGLRYEKNQIFESVRTAGTGPLGAAKSK